MWRRVTLLPAVAILMCACGADSGASRSAAPSATVGRELIGEGEMYAAASRYADLVFTAGTLPSDTSAPIENQVESALDNLEASLEASGAGLDTLLKVNIYLADWDDWSTFNSIYVGRIGEHGLPPRATVQIVTLGGDSLIEMEAIAHVRGTAP